MNHIFNSLIASQVIFLFLRNIDKWIVGFLQSLAAVQKYTILIDVTETKVEQVSEMKQNLSIGSFKGGTDCIHHRHDTQTQVSVNIVTI